MRRVWLRCCSTAKQLVDATEGEHTGLSPYWGSCDMIRGDAVTSLSPLFPWGVEDGMWHIEIHYPTQAKGRLEWGTEHLLPVWQTLSWGGPGTPTIRVLTMTPVVGIQTHPASGGDCYRHLWLCLYGTSPEVRLARLLLLRAGIGQIANDLPGPIILALEDVHTRLERADGSAGPGMR